MCACGYFLKTFPFLCQKIRQAKVMSSYCRYERFRRKSFMENHIIVFLPHCVIMIKKKEQLLSLIIFLSLLNNHIHVCVSVYVWTYVCRQSYDGAPSCLEEYPGVFFFLLLRVLAKDLLRVNKYSLITRDIRNSSKNSKLNLHYILKNVF